MSHIVQMQLVIKDLECLKKACDALGYTFIENATEYKWYGKFMNDYPMPEGMTIDNLGKCNHKIQIPGCSYEVGVVKKDDHYTLAYDFWYSGGLEKVLGRNAGPIKQQYTAEVTKKAARKKGYMVKEIREGKNLRVQVTIP